MRALVGAGGTTFLLRAAVTAPANWEPTFRLAGVQMVCEHTTDRRESAPPAHAALDLGPEDVPEMLDLVERTQPGPFRPATIRLGTYLGVRVHGALVAMAGERARPPGFTEVSAVCTDPAFRGQGLSTFLVREMITRVEARGEVPILHAAASNENAIRLYGALGFRQTYDFVGAMFRAPD